MTDTSRLDAIETSIAHQDEVIEDLNKTVIAQWKQIDRLSQQVARLMDQHADSTLTASSDPASEPPPPHW
ncbi:MAG: SlyX family protein [Hyphomonas sp.]|tara:strand:- start:102 stop:311 length:210 start_codon:yes stop_codon:yes gene_type:complete